jgi:type IV secretion system protein VirB11
MVFMRTSNENIITLLDQQLGPNILDLLADQDIIEVLLNPDGRLWIDSHQGRRDTGLKINARRAQTIISIVSGAASEETHRNAPLIEAELPGSLYRFTGLLPPIVASPTFTIRKRARQVFTLADYVDAMIMPQTAADYLKAAVRNKHNILVSGGTGSGKTTLTNALLQEISDSGDRVVMIEDTQELQCRAQDFVALRTKGPQVTLQDLIRTTLRLRPDRIIVGEVRGAEALDLLKAWNTGTPGGIATIHADSAVKALMRLEQLIAEVSVSSQRDAIAQTINSIVQIARTDSGRRVTEIIEVTGLSKSKNYTFETIYMKEEERICLIK